MIIATKLMEEFNLISPMLVGRHLTKTKINQIELPAANFYLESISPQFNLKKKRALTSHQLKFDSHKHRKRNYKPPISKQKLGNLRKKS